MRPSNSEGIGGSGNPKYAPRNVKMMEKKQPGRLVGVIAIQSENALVDDFNPHTLFWSVDVDRKDYNRVVQQSERKGGLPKYEKQLFDSCFKNWG